MVQVRGRKEGVARGIGTDVNEIHKFIADQNECGIAKYLNIAFYFCSS